MISLDVGLELDDFDLDVALENESGTTYLFGHPQSSR